MSRAHIVLKMHQSVNLVEIYRQIEFSGLTDYFSCYISLTHLFIDTNTHMRMLTYLVLVILSATKRSETSTELKVNFFVIDGEFFSINLWPMPT